MLAGCLPGWQTACHVVENFLHNSELLLYLCITIYVILFSYQLLYLGLMVPAGVIQNYSLTVHVGPWNIHVLLSAAFKPQSNPNCWHVQTSFLIENIGVWITIICIIIVLITEKIAGCHDLGIPGSRWIAFAGAMWSDVCPWSWTPTVMRVHSVISTGFHSWCTDSIWQWVRMGIREEGVSLHQEALRAPKGGVSRFLLLLLAAVLC